MSVLGTTVVIVTHNRRDELLHNLARHRSPVIVVDNASTDGTAEAVTTEYPHVQLVRLGKNQGAHGRTVGARLARTPYIAFSDDDSWWDAGSLEHAERAFTQYPRLGLIAGSIIVEADGMSRPDPINDVLASSPLGRAGAGPALLGFVACASVVRREAFFAAGGFDNVIRFPGEEERLAFDLDHGGWQIAYLPELVARHRPSQCREDREQRALGLMRSHLLTGLMRRPWSTVWSDTREAMRTARGRRAVLEALPRVPVAMTQRRVVGQATLARLAMLENS